MTPSNTRSFSENHTHSFLWSALQQFGGKGIAMVGAFILARLLGPEEFGIFALVSIPLVVCQHIIDGGLGQAMLQRKKLGEGEYSTFFWLNLAITILLIGIVALCSGYYAYLFDQPRIQSLLTVSTIGLMILNLSKTSEIWFVKNFNFKILTKISIIGNLIGLVAAVLFAFLGFGVWALVIQQAFFAVCNTGLKIVFCQWRPKFLFNRDTAVGLYKFGIPLCVSNVFRSIAGQLSSIVIGKNFPVSQLGYLSRGRLIPNHVMTATAAFMSRVNIPILADSQDDEEKRDYLFMQMFYRGVTTGLLLLVPLFVFADLFISLLLGKAWLPSMVIFQIAAFQIPVLIIWTQFEDLLKSSGMVKTISGVGILMAATQAIGVLVLAQYGLVWILLGDVFGRAAGCAILGFVGFRRRILKIELFANTLLQIGKMALCPAILAGCAIILPSWSLFFWITTTILSGILIFKVQGFLPRLSTKFQ